MKLTVVFVVVALIGATALVGPHAPGAQAAGSVHWRELFKQDVTVYTAERAPGRGAPGAGGAAFRVGERAQGTAIITGLDRPALGVFVGLSFPPEYANEPYGSTRLEFTLHDGSSRSVGPAAGSSTGMLFQSPDDLPVSRIAEVALFVDAAAEWTK